MFSNESSSCLPDNRHSHIGCIYSTFLHSAFSNVSSNCLPEKRHSHIGCIYSTFLHCAFSNVSSNGLYEKMHSHIDCIYLTWWHCRLFSSGSLHLHPLKQSHNSPFVLPSPLCVVLCPNDCLKLIIDPHIRDVLHIFQTSARQQRDQTSFVVDFLTQSGFHLTKIKYAKQMQILYFLQMYKIFFESKSL